MDEKIKERITEQYGPIKLIRGRWFIIANTLDFGPEYPHELWHLCDMKWPEDMNCAEYQTKSWYDDRPIKASWKCVCGATPPDTIVAVWCLLEPEYTSEAIKEAMIEPEPSDDDDEPYSFRMDDMDSESWDYMHDIGDYFER